MESQLEQIDLTTYLCELLERLLVSFGLGDRVAAKVAGPQILIGRDLGTPLSLLAAEVIGNSCKHAFPGERKGQITVRTEEEHGSVRLRIVDDGVGRDPDAPQARRAIGSRLVGSFAQQLDGAYRYSADQGTAFELSFPRPSTQGP